MGGFGVCASRRWDEDMKRAIGYIVGATAASLFYATYFMWWTEESTPTAPQASFGFQLGLALFFWLTAGFCATISVMALLWIAVVRAYAIVRLSGPAYFGGFGAVLTLVLGCTVSSLTPKPFFIEDQTFLEGFLIVAQRQGVCLLLAGFILGLTYWSIGERRKVVQR